MRPQATTNHVASRSCSFWNRLTFALGTGLEVPRCPTLRRAQMGKVNDENVRTGQQETNEPWKSRITLITTQTRPAQAPGRGVLKTIRHPEIASPNLVA